MLRQVASAQNPLVKHLVKLRQNRDYRYEHHSLVIEGITMVTEMGKDTHFRCVVVRDETLLPKGIKADDVLVVTDSVMEKISGLHSSEGIVAEIDMPRPAELKGHSRVIALDGISDPGNMGTLLRSALALGWEGAFILENSCDPFNEKAIRAARGATFRMPLAWGNWEQLKKLIKSNKMTPLAADLKGQKVEETNVKGNCLLVLGNEARGISEEAKVSCQALTIPMSGKMESLNVAAAGSILMYALGKKK